MDVNNDGALDMFIGINNQGSTTEIGFFAPGTGTNTSPNTTSIQNGVAQYQISETVSNFNYQLVNSTIDPNFVSLDLDTDSNTDVYLSLALPYFGSAGTATMQGAFAGLAGISIDLQSQFRYITATSTQSNSLNQDLGGVNGGTNSTLTYAQLGAMSSPVTASRTVVPEPATMIPFGLTAACLALAAGIRSRGLPSRVRSSSEPCFAFAWELQQEGSKSALGTCSVGYPMRSAISNVKTNQVQHLRSDGGYDADLGSRRGTGSAEPHRHCPSS